MSQIHYFQRYSQKENWVTNNTMLLFSRLNYYNQRKFENVLNQLIEDSQSSVNIGVSFSQQDTSNESTPDGMILQESFQIKIETKLYDNFSLDQLRRHLTGFKDSSETKVLLALSKQGSNEKVRTAILKEIKEGIYDNIKFGVASFKNIIDLISGVIEPHEIEMNEILEDYARLCEEHKLIDRSDQTMLAVTAGLSLAENLKYDIYYDPVGRNHSRNFKYLGLYDNKMIKAIGKINKIIYCNYSEGELYSSNDRVLDLNDDGYHRIKSIIEETDYYDLRSGNKFFLVEKFYDTLFEKESPSSLRGKKYFILSEYIELTRGMKTESIAKQLNGKLWE